MLNNYVIPPAEENIEILKSFVLRNEVVKAENALKEILDLLFVDRVCDIRFSTESVYDDEGGYNTYVADIEFLNEEGE